MNLLKAAHFYLENNINVLAINEKKMPLTAWASFQERLCNEDELKMFNNAYGIAVICGAVSGNIEVIDIDSKYDITGTLWDDFKKALGSLLDKLYVVQTRSGGYHLYYRCEKIEGNLKLANRYPTQEELEESPHLKEIVLIETRGEGGYVVAPPTKGYTRISTDLKINTITIEERELIFEVARSFNEVVKEYRIKADQKYYSKGDKVAYKNDILIHQPITPWEDYDQKVDVTSLLEAHGWTFVERKGDRSYFKRPGNTDSLVSGDYHHELNLFKVFTTSSQFEPGVGYKPSAVYTLLEHNGDFSAAAKQLLKSGYGTSQIALSAIHANDENGESSIFWLINDKKGQKSVTIIRHKLYDFFNDNGFHIYLYDKNNYQIIREVDGFIEEISREGLKQFIKEYIRSLPEFFDGIHRNMILEAIIRGAGIYFNDASLEFLNRKVINVLEDNQDEAFFSFNNGIIKVDKNGCFMNSYADYEVAIWRSQIIDHDIDISSDADPIDCEFYRFMQKVSGDNEEKVEYLMSLIGYVLHKYKDVSKSFAIILAEETEDEKMGGGTGKGILIKAISYMVNTVRMDGKNFKNDGSFKYQRVRLDTKLIAIDDVRKNADFEGFYSAITEGTTIEQKFKDEVFIPYENSPKILFSTNYTIPSNGNHAKRRQKVFEFSSFFTPENTPLDYFGHRLFNDWNEQEWNRFYILMLACVGYYLSFGIKDIKAGDKLKRKHIKINYSEEFLDWFDELSPGWKVFNNEYKNFIEVNGWDKKDYSNKRFKKAIQEAIDCFSYKIEWKRNWQNNGLVEFKVEKPLVPLDDHSIFHALD